MYSLTQRPIHYIRGKSVFRRHRKTNVCGIPRCLLNNLFSSVTLRFLLVLAAIMLVGSEKHSRCRCNVFYILYADALLNSNHIAFSPVYICEKRLNRTCLMRCIPTHYSLSSPTIPFNQVNFLPKGHHAQSLPHMAFALCRECFVVTRPISKSIYFIIRRSVFETRLLGSIDPKALKSTKKCTIS